jgi:maleylpyruvate isomerase
VTDYADPAAAAADLSAQLDVATRRLLQASTAVTDAQARQPSLLSGWSRGHLLTHIARNADGLRNLLVWARTGVETPQYASFEERDAGIAAGAGRPAGQLHADVAESAAAFAAEAARLAGTDWGAQVRGLRGPEHPAWYTLWRRLSEVEIHHVDLGTGYRPADWPDAFAGQSLARIAPSFTGADCPRVTLHATDSGAAHEIGPAAAGPEPDGPRRTVSGPARDLLAWLVGRSDGAGLAASPAGPPPGLPPW